MKKITLSIALLLSGITFSQEILLNGGFENWDDTTTPTSFSKAEDSEQETTEKHSGSFSVKHTGGTKDIAQTVPVVAGNSYTISLWYKTAQEGDGQDARIWSYWKEGTSSIADNPDELRGPAESISGNGGYLPNNSEWTQYTTTLTAPATADNLYFEVRTYSNAITYWDDFSVFNHGSTLSIKNNTISDLVVTTTNGKINTNKGEIVNIYNIVGQQVINQNLSSGVYVVTIVENSLVVVEKVYVD